VTYSADSRGGTPLRLTSQVSSHSTIVGLTGELDLATAGQLPRFVGTLAPDECHWVHLDLSGLSFLDAAGITALLRANTLVEQRSGRMTIGRPQPLARMLFELTAVPLTVVDHADASCEVVRQSA
jgi:anti-sigma B factor antagonist